MSPLPSLDPLHHRLIGNAIVAALRAADPYTAVAQTLSINAGFLTVTDPAALPSDPPLRYQLDAIKRVRVLGAGKGGVGMAEAVRSVFNRVRRRVSGCITVKEGFGGGKATVGSISINEAAHPLPDERSLEATRRLISLALTASARDLFLVLLSGGGSALLEWPAPGLTLADMQATTRTLMHAGADIHQLNVVRKHLSQVKGGGLARLIAPAPILTLILSDVVGDDPSIIASGPTTPDRSTFADALAIAELLGVSNQLPPAVRHHLTAGVQGERLETAKPGNRAFVNCHQVIVASNATSVHAAQHALLGNVSAVAAHSLGSDPPAAIALHGEARNSAHLLVAALCANLDHPATFLPANSFQVSPSAASQLAAPRTWAIILGGETSVTVRGSGRGGRNQEFALAAAIALDELRAQLTDYKLTIATFATDGDDGSGGAAGAIADRDTVSLAASLGLDARVYLANNDSHSFWQLLDQRTASTSAHLPHHIISGPTGTNVNDLCIIIAQHPA